MGDKYLIFLMDNESYAIPIRLVSKISEKTDIAQIPCAPKDIKGIINHNGKIVPVIDLHKKLKINYTAPNSRSCIIIADITEDNMLKTSGFVVDTVCDVLSLQSEDIGPAPSPNKSEYILGVGKLDDKIIRILNLEKIIGSNKPLEMRNSSDKEF